MPATRLISLVCLCALPACTLLLRPGDAGPSDDADVERDADRAAGDADHDLDEATGPDATGPDAAGPDADADAEEDAEIDAGAPCDDGAVRCVRSALFTCAGGLWVLEQSCPMGCAETGRRCLELDPSNVPAALLERAEAEIVVDGNRTFDTGECISTDLGHAYTERVSLGGIPEEACVVVATRLVIERGALLRVFGDAAMVFLVTGEVRVEGTLDVSGHADDPGPGGGVGAAPQTDAFGECGGGAGIHGEENEDTGGGGAGHSGRGGRGGGSPSSGGGPGGLARGDVSLEPLTAGCGGGGGGTQPGFGAGGRGGAGGGALQISSATEIAILGVVNAGGGGGEGSPGYSAGGGGGAGGGILLEAPVFTIEGVIAANGGGGGGGADGEFAGGNGADGLPSDDQASGGVGVNEPAGQAGGRGGAGEVVNGEPGAAATYNGGGGGGAAGRIRLNSLALPIRIDGAVSPSISPGFTQGALRVR